MCIDLAMIAVITATNIVPETVEEIVSKVVLRQPCNINDVIELKRVIDRNTISKKFHPRKKTVR